MWSGYRRSIVIELETLCEFISNVGKRFWQLFLEYITIGIKMNQNELFVNITIFKLWNVTKINQYLTQPVKEEIWYRCSNMNKKNGVWKMKPAISVLPAFWHARI